MTEDPLTEEPSNQSFDTSPATDPPPTGPPLVRRLRRRVDGSLGGVAGGVADYLKIDPVFVRIAFVLLAIVGSGGGILLYLAAWVLLPDQTNRDPRPVALNDGLASIVIGGLLVLAAVSFTFGSITLGLDADVVVPLAIAAIGFYLLNQRAEGDSTGTVLPAQENWPAPPADPRGSSSEFVADSGPPHVAPAPPPPQPAPAVVTPSTWAPPLSTQQTSSEPTHWATPVVHTAPAVPVAPKPPVTSVTLAVAAVIVGSLLAISQLRDLDLGSGTFFGAFATVCGLGLIASAFIGRARPLIPIGLISLLGLGLAPLVDTTIDGGFGPREYVVTSEDDLRSSYEVGGGYIELDLRRLDLTEDRTVDIEVGAGYAEIVVPRDVTVQINADNQFGYVDVFGREQSGVSSSVSRSADASGEADGDGPTLTINVTVTFGSAEVSRG